MKAMTACVVCTECGRRFDLRDTDEAEEWYYGHDCEGWPLLTDGYLGGDEDQ